jgi:hypothetical protein
MELACVFRLSWPYVPKGGRSARLDVYGINERLFRYRSLIMSSSGIAAVGLRAERIIGSYVKKHHTADRLQTLHPFMSDGSFLSKEVL